MHGRYRRAMDLRRELAPMYRNLDGDLGSGVAAGVIVPLVMQRVRPQSVLDLGAGVGSFLRAFIEHNVTDVAGIDLCLFEPELFVVDPTLISRGDLKDPVHQGRRYDLAMSLEVGAYLADHDVLVDSLVRHAPVVVFSAALPSQDLLHQHHGAFPSSWAARFAARDYVVVDAFRPALWTDDRLPFWFRQNLLLFVHRPHLEANPGLGEPSSESAPLDIVHPELYRMLAGTDADASLKLALARIPRIARAKAPRLADRLRRRVLQRR